MSPSVQAVAQASVPQQPWLLDRVRAACRLRHYSMMRTEEAYVSWVRRFILFHHKQQPLERSAAHINQFLTHRRWMPFAPCKNRWVTRT